MQNIYDNKKFFDDYVSMRNGKINANDLIERPMFKSLLPKLNGKKILDLGCGFGDLCSYMVSNGATKVVGLDISKRMIELANQKNSNKVIQYIVKPMEKLSDIKEQFDIVTSSLAFHYVENFDKLISDIAKLLKPNGRLIFSEEHPLATCFVPPENNPKLDHKIDFDGKRYYLISDYNNMGKRILKWNVDGVIKYHRNFSEIANTLIKNGFEIERVEESRANESVIEKEPKFAYQNDRPYFIFFVARKTNY